MKPSTEYTMRRVQKATYTEVKKTNKKKTPKNPGSDFELGGVSLFLVLSFNGVRL